MRSYFISFLLTVLSIYISQNTVAQNNNTQKAKEDLKKSWTDLKEAFKLKKNQPATNQPANTNQQPQNQQNTGTSTVPQQTTNIHTSSKKGPKPGDLAPDVKYIEADELGQFSGGAAIVKKGLSTALIDAKGNFIVPYNTYNFAEQSMRMTLISHRGFVNFVPSGLFNFYTLDSRAGGVMNSKGKIICQCFNAERSEDGTMVMVRENNNTTTYYDFNGNKYPQNKLVERMSEGIGIVQSGPLSNGPSKFGYVRLNGQQLTGFLYEMAYPFSDGMAVVAKRDEFRELKYGFIDKTGKEVVPVMFSMEPRDFISGYAKVMPKDNSEFASAFINKKGGIVYKQPNGKDYFEYFSDYGLAISPDYQLLMDTDFKIESFASLFKSLGVSQPIHHAGLPVVVGQKNPKFFYRFNNSFSPVSNNTTMGFVNYATRKVIEPVFEIPNQPAVLHAPFLFDPVSQLTYAMIATGKDAQGRPVYREGYINEDGLFVIVKGAASKW